MINRLLFIEDNKQVEEGWDPHPTDKDFDNKKKIIYEMYNFIQLFNNRVQSNTKKCTDDLYNMLNAHYNLNKDKVNKKYWDSKKTQTIDNLGEFNTYIKMIDIVSNDLTKKNDDTLGIMIINDKYEIESTYNKPESIWKGNYTSLLDQYIKSMETSSNILKVILMKMFLVIGVILKDN